MPLGMRMLVAILAVAATATLADFTWYSNSVRHTVGAAIVYGASVLTVVGAALGASCGRTRRGLPLGAIAGVGGALSYYLLIVLVDSRVYGPAIPGAWTMLWLLLAVLDGRWLRAPGGRGWSEIAVRGVLAAVVGGIAFGLVRNVLWGPQGPAGRNYALQFATWAVAWAPGILALAWPRRDELHERHARTSTKSMTAAEILARIDSGDRLYVLDVRSEREFVAGRVPGAVNIPFNQVASRTHEVPGSESDELILYCGHGPRAHIAAAALRRAGRRRITYLSGHFSGWEKAGMRVER